MFLEVNAKSVRSPFNVLAVLTLAITVLWSGASTVNAQTVPTTRLHDFVGDNRTDFTTVVYSAGLPIRWKVLGNPAPAAPNAAFKREFTFGLFDTDDITEGDYVGDSKTDPAVYRSSNSTFYVGNFPTGTGGVTLNRAVPFGNGATDVAGGQGDYDGDGKTDYTLVRVINSNLVWYIMSSSTNTVKGITHGTLTGVTGPSIFPGADFNGDGRDELIYLYRNAAGTQVTYQIGDSNTGAGVMTRVFGNYNNDFSVAPDDYTGDGRADFVAVRQTQGAQSIWYIQNSVTNTVMARAFGIADPTFNDPDLPVRGDFDGDGTHDICVWRSSNQTFYYISSVNGSIQGQKHGDPGDTPLGSFGLY